MSGNPYLPPMAETDVPDAPQSHGWFVRDGHLHVETNAQLPMVDLFTGETADRMILHSMKITRNPFWLIALIWTAVSLAILSIGLGNTPLVSVTGPLALVTGLTAGVSAILTRSLRLKVFFTRRSSRRLTVLSICGSILAFALGFLFLSQIQFGDSRSGNHREVAGMVFLVVLAIRIVMPFFFKRLTCRRIFGSHFEIRGVHPVALEQLHKLSQG